MIPACVPNKLSKTSSTIEKSFPPFLFATSNTALTSPSGPFTGDARMFRVFTLRPVSCLNLKRASAYASGMCTVSPVVATKPTMPSAMGTRTSCALPSADLSSVHRYVRWGSTRYLGERGGGGLERRICQCRRWKFEDVPCQTNHWERSIA